MSLLYKSIGSAIKKARIGKKMTQEKLSEAIGITSIHIKQLESGRRKPSVDVLFKLVETLDFSVDSLFIKDNPEFQELKSKINLSLNKCDVHELNVAYSTIEAMLNKPGGTSGAADTHGTDGTTGTAE